MKTHETHFCKGDENYVMVFLFNNEFTMLPKSTVKKRKSALKKLFSSTVRATLLVLRFL